jgi:hypothetical protein
MPSPLLNIIQSFYPNRIFGYIDLTAAGLNQKALSTALRVLVLRKKIVRIMKGRYMIASASTQPNNPAEIVRAICLFRNKICGYETGPSVWEKWNLIPKEENKNIFYVAINNMRPAQTHQGITIRFKKARLDPAQFNIVTLQLLDAIEAFNAIAGTSHNSIVEKIIQLISEQNETFHQQLANYVLAYRPATRALTGALLQHAGIVANLSLIRTSLNFNSIYKLNISLQALPEAKSWNIAPQQAD